MKLLIRVTLTSALFVALMPRAPQAQTIPQSPLWKVESDQAGAGMGSSVAAAGDVNADGYADVLVGTYSWSGDLFDEGRADLYLGSASGPSKLPVWTVEGDQAHANLGEALAGAGDVNGDGYDDVLIGATGFDNHTGRATLYLGSAAGLTSSPAWTAEPGGRDFAFSLASAGDVNGDGYDDVIVGSIGFTDDLPDEGRVYVYHGSALGLAAAPAWTVEGNQGYCWFGGAVAGAGDVNGDGYDDVIVGAPRFNNGQNDEGRAFVYLGSAAGLPANPAWLAESDQATALFGQWVAGAGDVNGDGYDDVAVCANGFSHGEAGEGRHSVYLGSASGPALSPSWTVESNQFAAGAGAVSSGDFDGDGYSDLIVGFYEYDHDQLNEGATFVYFGSPAGLAPRTSWLAEGNKRNCSFGFALAGAGDVNGDGYDDVLVGAYEFEHGEAREGRAFAYLGAPRRRLP